MIKRFKTLVAFDWLFTRPTRSVELMLTLVAIFVGGTLLGENSTLFRLAKHAGAPGIVFMFTSFILGNSLLAAGLVRMVGLISHAGGFVILSRLLRWAGALAAGVVWWVASFYTYKHTLQVPDLQVIFTIFAAQETWLLTSIAYRGYRGKDRRICNEGV